MIVNYLIPSGIAFIIIVLLVIKLSQLRKVPGNKGVLLLESLRFHGVSHSSNRSVINFFRKSDTVNRIMYTLIGFLILVFFILKNVAR